MKGVNCLRSLYGKLSIHRYDPESESLKSALKYGTGDSCLIPISRKDRGK